MIAYKYCDERGVDVLKNLRIKITRPEEFNDPFEFSPRIVGELSEAQAEEMFADEEFVRQQFKILEDRGGNFAGGYDAFRKIFAQPFCRKELTKRFPSEHLETMRELARKNLAQVSEQFAVLCLSTVGDSIAMWSHYADKHRGIVIGFDSDHPHFANRNWFTVDYAKDRVGVDIAWTLRRTEAPDGTPLKTLKTKCDVWSYERELRSMFKLSDLDSISLNGKKEYFWKIPKDVIREVKLGCRCPEATEDSVRAAILSSDLRVRMEKADLDDTHFALVFRPA
jgi:Protein of unknown function (DUF2971)